MNIFPGYKVHLTNAAVFPRNTNFIFVESCARQILRTSPSSKTLLEAVFGTLTV